MNKFLGIGRNTKDGEIRHNSQDVAMYNNTLAIKNNFKNKDGNYDTEFINYVAFRQTADYLNKYSKKGTLISIEGRVSSRNYEDKDKIKRYVTEIIVENASVLEKKDDDVKEVNEFNTLDTKTIYKEEKSDVTLSDADLPF